MPDDVKNEIRKSRVNQREYTDLHEVISDTDVLYVTRIQRERFLDLSEYEMVKDAYIINNAILSNSKPQMIVMHPLPRVNEIDPEVDFDDRAAYFRQMRYGMFVRMALLALVSFFTIYYSFFMKKFLFVIDKLIILFRYWVNLLKK
jgi:carbamoyl-phosphate synthase/aspartate carbamoyltransferase